MSTATAKAPNDLDLSGVLDGVAPAERNPAVPASTKRRKTVAQGNRRPPLYFDLETVPDEERMHLFGLDPLPTKQERRPYEQCPKIEAASAWAIEAIKKALSDVNPCEQWLAELEAAEKAKEKPRKGVFDTIAEIRDQDLRIATASEERQKLMSVTPEFSCIVALGWSLGEGDECRALLVGQQASGGAIDEATLIEHFWTLAARCGTVVGFNVLSFDLPTIFVRSALLQVDPSRQFDLTPWKSDVIDLYQKRFPKGSPKGFGLKNLNRIYGFGCEEWELDDETDGSHVAKMLAEDREKLAVYVRSDVAKTKRLHAFYSGLFV